ncbi:DUF4185 domain-containing protein, partial [Candidatus Sumerlaeota bacterium]|nr:DUF4185 domain-containing protein [Candidatus Sumerlaeota bacterium]
MNFHISLSVLLLLASISPLAAETARDFHPASPIIKDIVWAPKETIACKAPGSDNFPMTWADDDNLYAAYGDGWGFEPRVAEKLSLGFVKVSGSPSDFTGINIRSQSGEDKGDGKDGKKASGMLMVDGILYMWVRNAGNSQLAWSTDHARTWKWCDWKFTTSFGCPTFLNFGKNYVGARDECVYIYSHDSDSAYTAADRMVLARVKKDQILNRDSYEFFQRTNTDGKPVWTRDIGQRGAVFTRVGKCYRSGVTYNAALKRYLWCQTLPPEPDARFCTGFGIFDAPEPWGPWTAVFSTENWDVGPGETSSFPTKWMSADGKTVALVFSGDDSFSVRKATLVLAGDAKFTPRTRVALFDGKWHINGRVTYRGTKTQGLLMNVRMVNSTFEDRKQGENAASVTSLRGFDPEANTDRFIAHIPEYAAHGVRAFTLCLQGGMPGYEGAVNSAFNPDGSLRDSYLRRIQRVIETCDRHGMAVILGCYYQRQDQILKGEAAVRAGVVNAVKWIKARGFTNVALEIANEFPHKGFDHRILRTPEGEVELIRLAKQTAPDLLVSTSGIGDGKFPDSVAEASDFVLIHFNGVPVAEIPKRIAALKKFGKPIVCNEDDKFDNEAAQAAELSVANGASWGLMLNRINQYFPLQFNGAADDPIVY